LKTTTKIFHSGKEINQLVKCNERKKKSNKGGSLRRLHVTFHLVKKRMGGRMGDGHSRITDTSLLMGQSSDTHAATRNGWPSEHPQTRWLQVMADMGDRHGQINIYNNCISFIASLHPLCCLNIGLRQCALRVVNDTVPWSNPFSWKPSNSS
jgi:hypothetical protein